MYGFKSETESYQPSKLLPQTQHHQVKEGTLAHLSRVVSRTQSCSRSISGQCLVLLKWQLFTFPFSQHGHSAPSLDTVQSLQLPSACEHSAAHSPHGQPFSARQRTDLGAARTASRSGNHFFWLDLRLSIFSPMEKRSYAVRHSQVFSCYYKNMFKNAST